MKFVGKSQDQQCDFGPGPLQWENVQIPEGANPGPDEATGGPGLRAQDWEPWTTHPPAISPAISPALPPTSPQRDHFPVNATTGGGRLETGGRLEKGPRGPFLGVFWWGFFAV